VTKSQTKRKRSKKEPKKTQQRNTWVSQTATAELHHPGVENQALTIKQTSRRENKKQKKSSEEE
jgi:hypothetical protein